VQFAVTSAVNANSFVTAMPGDQVGDFFNASTFLPAITLS
jgi:hypothetical protein